MSAGLAEEKMSALTLEGIIGFLLDTPMFAGLESDELTQIVHIMQVQRVRGGQRIFREGETGDAWYVVYEGEVSVMKEQALGPSQELALLGKQTCFGEMALIDGSPRSAAVTAVGEGTLFRFAKRDFDGLLADGNLSAFKLVHEMAKVLCERQRRMTNRLTNMVTGPLPTEQMLDELRQVAEEHSVHE